MHSKDQAVQDKWLSEACGYADQPSDMQEYGMLWMVLWTMLRPAVKVDRIPTAPKYSAATE